MDIFFKSSKKEAPPPKVQIKTEEPVKTSSSVVITGDTNKYDADFDAVMKECNVPGPDYYEFMQAINNPALAALPEQQRYIATFAPISAMGATKDKLVETANFYLGKLEEQKSSFETRLSRTRENRVDSKLKEVEQLKDENDRMTQRMQENIKKIGELTAESNEATVQLNAAQTTFEMALKKKTDMIQSHITNIQNYL